MYPHQIIAISDGYLRVIIYIHRTAEISVNYAWVDNPSPSIDISRKFTLHDGRHLHGRYVENCKIVFQMHFTFIKCKYTYKVYIKYIYKVYIKFLVIYN